MKKHSHSHSRRIMPSIQTRGSKTQKKSVVVKSMSQSSVKFGSWRREKMENGSRPRRKLSQTEKKALEIEEDNNGVDFECEKEEIQRKIEALQRIVPGGDSLRADKLFEKTADYILFLQRQVKTLRTLSSFFESLDKENTKFGG